MAVKERVEIAEVAVTATVPAVAPEMIGKQNFKFVKVFSRPSKGGIQKSRAPRKEERGAGNKRGGRDGRRPGRGSDRRGGRRGGRPGGRKDERLPKDKEKAQEILDK